MLKTDAFISHLVRLLTWYLVFLDHRPPSMTR